MFMSLYVIYGFDTASTLAEETRNPRVEAPKAVIASVIGAFVIGAVFLYACLLAIPNMKDAIADGFGPAQIIDANFGNAFSTVFLLVVSAAIFVCCLSIETSTIRLCFGMSRDDTLPASKALSKVHPRLHTPIGACIAIGLLSAIPMIQYAGVGDHRDRGDGDDLLQLPDREHRAPPRAPARLAADEGAVLARPLGHSDSRCSRLPGAAGCSSTSRGRAAHRATNPTPSSDRRRSTSTGTG